VTGQSTGSAVDRAPGEELELGSEQIAVKPADRQSFVTEQLQSLGVRLQDALETLPDAFFILDRSWRFTYLNGQAERLLRRSRAELLGKNIWEEFAQAVGTESDRSYRRAMEEGITVRFEQFYPPLGRWLSAEAHPTQGGGRAAGADGGLVQKPPERRSGRDGGSQSGA
jgi:PAS domain S-box-containing protein